MVTIKSEVIRVNIAPSSKENLISLGKRDFAFGGVSSGRDDRLSI